MLNSFKQKRNIASFLICFLGSFLFLNCAKNSRKLSEGKSSLSAQEDLARSFSFEKSEIKTLVRIAQDIESQFSPDLYFYVGIGRSPTPVIMALQGRNSSNVLHFPASKLNQVYVENLTDLEQLRYQKHFDKYFNSIVSLEPSKKILLIDYISTGVGLVKAKKLFEKFIPYSKDRYEMLALLNCKSNLMKRLEESKDCDIGLNHMGYLIDDGIKFLKYSDSAQAKRFKNERYDIIAKYSFAPFHPSEGLEEVKMNPYYAANEKRLMLELKY